MRPPILTFRKQPDGSEHVLIGYGVFGFINEVNGGPRVEFRLRLQDQLLVGKPTGDIAAARTKIMLHISDWFVGLGIFDVGEEIEMRLERATK